MENTFHLIVEVLGEDTLGDISVDTQGDSAVDTIGNTCRLRLRLRLRYNLFDPIHLLIK